MRQFAEYLLDFVATEWGPVVLVTHAFLEAFILPVTHELFLIPIALARPHLSFVFALASTIASTTGIMVGYGLGRLGGRPILMRLFKPRVVATAKDYIHRYDAWAIAIACFTPIPVKVFALVAGATEMSIRKMIVIGFISRGLRYFLVVALIYFHGNAVREWILTYINWVMGILLGAMVLSIIGWKWIERLILRKNIKKEFN